MDWSLIEKKLSNQLYLCIFKVMTLSDLKLGLKVVLSIWTHPISNLRRRYKQNLITPDRRCCSSRLRSTLVSRARSGTRANTELYKQSPSCGTSPRTLSPTCSEMHSRRCSSRSDRRLVSRMLDLDDCSKNSSSRAAREEAVGINTILYIYRCSYT